MRLYSFRIKNFKSIEDTGDIKLSLDDNVTIFAGQNEAGKSAILEALDFFEQGMPLGEFDETFRRVDTSPRVECSYRLSDEELDEIETNGSKELRDYIAANGYIFVRGRSEEDDFAGIKYINADELKRLVLAINTARKEADPDAEPEKYNLDYLFEIRPQFIFYSGFDDYILPNKITAADLGTNAAVSDFEKVFDIDFAKLLEDPSDTSRARKISIVNENASANLNDYWSQKLEDEPVTYDYNIDANVAVPTTDSSITFLIDQGDHRFLHFAQKSRGFRWFSSFNLKLRAHENESNNLHEAILLIDEPGQGLHEEAQKDAKRVLNEIAGKGMQILFSTHQPQLLREDSDVKLSRIKLVVKTKADGTMIRNIAQQSSTAGFKDALSPIRTAMGLISLDVTSIVDSRNSLIVEGITDYYYIKAFLHAKKVESVALIPSVGAPQVPNIYSILNGWGVKAKAITDDDGAGTKALNQIRSNLLCESSEADQDKLLYKNAGCKGIEDTFDAADFLSFASDNLPSQPPGKSNAELAKLNGSKEIIARTFLDKIENGDIKLTSLSAETKKRISKLVKFIES